jgi:hypothetical protein
MSWKIVVMDDTLTGEAAVDLSDRIRNSLLSHQYASTKANNAALVIGQFVSCNIGKKKDAKKPVLKAPSLFFEDFHKLRKVRLTSVGFHLRYISLMPANAFATDFTHTAHPLSC